jgi:hypothetical protein
MKEGQRIKEKWPSLIVRHKARHHAKCVIIKYPRSYEIWIGSINLGKSTYSDIMYKVPVKADQKKIINRYMGWVANSKKL